MSEPADKPTDQTAFWCRPLGCLMRMGMCRTRQETSERQQRKTQRHRGSMLDFPTCTDRCALGVGIRRALEAVSGPAALPHPSPYGGVDKPPAEKARQRAAKARRAALGLEDDIPTIDSGRPPEES